MDAEAIKLNDWLRMFIGEVPPAFFIEVVLRMIFVYLLLLFSMRLLGKRMASQLTRNELAALVSLAGAMGVPLLAPDRGLLPPVLVAVVVVSLSRLLAFLSFKNQKTEGVIHGKIDILVNDSVMNVERMMATRITRERIMAQLRSEKIMHLGEVQKLFIEANGNFTLIRTDKPKPGLAVLPDRDEAFINDLKPNGIMVCHACGMRNDSGNTSKECPNCRQMDWVISVERPESV